MSICDFHKNNPSRPVDWRWLRAACLLRENKRVGDRSGDSWVRRAIDYQAARQSCRNEQELEKLDGRYPGFAAAVEIWSAPRSVRKATMESALLARGSNAQVGERVGLSPQAVEIYEALFFNVRERLTASAYIMSQAIGSKVYTGLDAEDFDLILKMLAYHCGPGMINLVLSLYPTEPGSHGEGEASPASVEDMSNNIPVKIALVTLIGGDTFEALDTMLSVKFMEAKWKSGEIKTEEFDEVLDVLLAGFKRAITAKPQPHPVVCLPDRQGVQGAGPARGHRSQSVARPGRAQTQAKIGT